MAILTIRDLDDAAKADLQALAAANGRSMEAEARMAIYSHVKTRPKKRDLSAITPVLPAEPEGFDWFATDEDELRAWDGP